MVKNLPEYRNKVTVDTACNTTLTRRRYYPNKPKRIYSRKIRDTNSKEAMLKRQNRRCFKLCNSMEAYNGDEFQLWFIEFHSKKEYLGVAELITYVDERFHKLNGQGISVVVFFLGYHEYDSSGNKFPHLHCVLVTRL